MRRKTLIHGNSNDPVLIKKIYLKLWSLRQEIEAVLRLKTQEKGEPLTNEEKELIKNEYLNNGKTPQLTVIEGGASASNEEAGESSGDDLEAEMAAAMGGDETAAEENKEDDTAQSGDDLEAEMAAAMGGGEESAAEQETPQEDNTNGPKLVIQRDSTQLDPKNVFKGMTFLSEISMDEMYFFSSQSFLVGQSIVIELQVPQKFVLNADIIYCRAFNHKSRIISENKLPYRIVAKFTFLKEGERTLLRQFVQSIEPEIPVEPVIKPKAQADDGGDEFDDLDGLDF